MRIFETDTYPHKINFVDDNNTFVGFDFESNCCECFNYWISKVRPVFGSDEYLREIEIEGANFPGFNFDTSFVHDPECGDEEGAVTFRLTNEAGEELFLTLTNHHNGYYSHGFEMKKDGSVIHEGSL